MGKYISKFLKEQIKEKFFSMDETTDTIYFHFGDQSYPRDSAGGYIRFFKPFMQVPRMIVAIGSDTLNALHTEQFSTLMEPDEFMEKAVSLIENAMLQYLAPNLRMLTLGIDTCYEYKWLYDLVKARFPKMDARQTIEMTDHIVNLAAEEGWGKIHIHKFVSETEDNQVFDDLENGLRSDCLLYRMAEVANEAC